MNRHPYKAAMAAKTSSPPPQPQALTSATTLKLPKDIDPRHVSATLGFLGRVGLTIPVPEICNKNGFFSDFVRSFVKVDRIERGRITCTILVTPPIINSFKTLHGGAVGAAAELISIACAKTVIAEEKEPFLGEMSISYLSSAPKDAEVLADCSVMKSGRNLTVVALEFRLKKTGKLIYTARATFYNMPVARL